MLKDKFDAARKLTPAEWRLLVQAWLLLLPVDLGLWVLPFPRLQAWASRVTPGGYTPLPAEAEAVICQTYRMVSIASRNHLYEMTCLRRSLVTQRLLARRGIGTCLRFGVQKEAGRLQAHAWLEYERTPIGEPETLNKHFVKLAFKEERS